MELAISPSTPGLSVSELADLCRFAEDLGYSQAWLAEVAGPDAFVLAAAVAQRTERMESGVGVVPAYTRTPAGPGHRGGVGQPAHGRAPVPTRNRSVLGRDRRAVARLPYASSRWPGSGTPCWRSDRP